MKSSRSALRFNPKESILCVLDKLFLDICLYRFGWTDAVRPGRKTRRSRASIPARPKEETAA